MSYALRTTLLLGAFWLLVFLVGVYQVHIRMRTDEENLTENEKDVREELELSESLVASLPAIEDELEEIKYAWEHRRKAITKSETSHETYDYLDQILTRRQTTLNFDYASVDERDSSGIHISDYDINGEARFIDLYRFIWYIEHLPRYLRLNSMEMTENSHDAQKTTTSERWVKFRISLTALSADRPGFDAVQYAVEINPPGSSYDPFVPPQKATPKIPPNTRGLPNVFESSLRALTPTQAYLIDQKGELKILALGDEVYLGKLVDILPDENRAIFDLNQLYPPRRVPLVVNTGK